MTFLQNSPGKFPIASKIRAERLALFRPAFKINLSFRPSYDRAILSRSAEAYMVPCEENYPMIEASPSRTALVTSLMRALHSRRDPSPLLDDPWGDRLVPEVFRDGFRQRILARMDTEARAAALRAPDSILDDYLFANAAYPGVVLRSRYAEDALRAAV